LSPAATPVFRIPVGVVIERRKAASQWIDFTWRPVGVLPDEPDMTPWTLLREEDDAKSFYAGSATVDLYRSETARYRENLMTGAPGIWVALSPSEGEHPYTIAVVTADPAEGEGFNETAAYIVEQVPMPEAIREAVAQFVDEHHVEHAFVKRKQKPADPEALAQRGPASGSAKDRTRDRKG
jgi:Protein of unknown function (DUF3305)